MQKTPGLFVENLPSIKSATWYRQRFDACPHFMFFLGLSHITTVQDTAYPYGQGIAYAGFSKNRADWYHSLQELEKTATGIIEADRKEPGVSKRMIADFQPWEDEFYAECEKLRGIDLTKLSDDELLKMYRSLEDIYVKKLNCSGLIDGFALSTDTMIAGKIKVFLDEKGIGDRFTEYFSILTAGTFSSFLQQEEIALIDIALSTSAGSDEESGQLRKHTEAFFWIRNNYVKDHMESIETFADRLRELRSENIVEKKNALISLPIQHREAKDALIAEIGLPQDIVALLRITDDFNGWQDERKKGTFWATHYFSVLLEEFARRTEYTIDELKYAFPPEMGDVLSKKLSREELQRRISYCMILWTYGKYDVVTDQKFIDELDRIGTGESEVVESLKGFAASLGTVTGRVCIVESVEEIGKVQNGDVLVSVMTRPDYVAAMKKASAFVTDEGGITCHAAIIAREMKKPCVIGTKIATKVLHDGDIVKVDAMRGMVKVIFRA